MKENFEKALAFTLRFEGGWSDHPRDPGGATMKGITLAVYRAFKGRNASKAELRAISDADLRAIYRENYWNAAQCDRYPAGYDACMFDYAVNSGPGRALRHSEEVSWKNMLPPARIKALCARRMSFLKALSTFDVFGRGWTRRVAELEAVCLKMHGAPSDHLRATAAEAGILKNRAAGGAAVVGASPAAASQVPVETISPVVLWCGLSVVAIALLYLGWRFVAHHRRQQALEAAAAGE